jgi:type II secretion system protein N
MASETAGFAGRLTQLLARHPLRNRSAIGYATWTAGWFLVFLVLTFPHDLVVRHWTDQITERSGWRLRFEDASFRPWSGYHLTQARLIAPGKDLEPWVATEQVGARPWWTAVLRGSVFPIFFSGSAYAGTFEGSVDPSGILDLWWSDLHLSEYPRLTRLLEGTWAGNLSGEIHLSGKGDFKNPDGRAHLGLSSASLTQAKAQGFTIPDLHFASGDADLEMKGNRIDIRSLKLSGSEVDAELHGQLFLSASGSPVLNAALTLRPIPGAVGGLEPLLVLLNHNQKPPGGGYSFNLYGPLAALRVR